MATIYEVSKLAGVSLATVSRVMNKSSSVSDKTRAKVEKAMEQLGYRPNTVAKSLASSRSNCVGILVGQLHGHFYGTLMSGIETTLKQADKHVVITASHCEEKQEKDDIEFLLSRNCDALILHVEAVSDEYLIELSKGKTPIFILNRHIPQIAEKCISLDNELGGYLATKTLLEQGHKELVYIAGPEIKADAQQRLKGHKRALTEVGLRFDEEQLYFGDYMQTGGVAGWHHFKSLDYTFSAVICANDEMATGVMAAARTDGLNVPEQLSIMGFDNALFSSYTYPTLSTIDYPVEEMGAMAAKAVLKQVYGKKYNIHNLFKPSIVLRNSILPKPI